eukprot:gene16801-20170_t
MNCWPTHLPYLHSQEQALGQKFTVAATVHIEPLGIYSHRHTSFAQVPDKGTVAVPNNVTNLSRALYLLQANGLITLKPGFNDPAKDQATPKDIAENPRHLKILEIESPQIPRALDDVDLAVINGNYALEAGLSPAKDALGLEKAQGNPYANILVTTPKLQDDPRIKQLAKDLNSPEVAKFITEKYAGSVIPQVSKTYADGQPPALDNVSLQIADGSIFGIVGRSGAGKSTLLRCLNLLERPTSGRILMDGQDLTLLSDKQLRQQRQRIGMIFQGFNLLHSRNVADNVAVPLEIAGQPKAERVARVKELLELVGLSDKALAFPSQLSGGQKQRV